MIKTPWKRFIGPDGERYKIRAEFGLHAIGSQAPYFSVTGTIMRQARNNRWVDDRAGQIREDIAKHFPELVPYMPWHLTSVQGPMHYLENAKYWWEKVLGISQWETKPWDTDPAEAFAHTIVLGGLPDDEMPPLDTPLPEVMAWLRERFPRLRRAFIDDMRTLRNEYGPDFGDIRHVTSAKDWFPGFAPGP
jgi:hypothetical protein